MPASVLAFENKDALLADAIQYGYDHWRASTSFAVAGAVAGFEGAVRARVAQSARAFLAASGVLAHGAYS